MNINITAEQEAFLKAHFDTNNVETPSQEHFDRWVQSMADAVHIIAPTAAQKKEHLEAATGRIIDEKSKKNGDIIKPK